MTIENTGTQGVAFYMFNLLIPGLKPLKYAVEANKTLTDELYVNSQGNYSYALHGPNGFIREFSGNHNT